MISVANKFGLDERPVRCQVKETSIRLNKTQIIAMYVIKQIDVFITIKLMINCVDYRIVITVFVTSGVMASIAEYFMTPKSMSTFFILLY
jgi:hypothetical protein